MLLIGYLSSKRLECGVVYHHHGLCFRYLDIFKGYSVMDVISLTVMYVATFTVGQEAVSRYYAARDGKAARQGSVLAAIVNFIYAFIPTIMGIIVLALINMGKFNAAGSFFPYVLGHYWKGASTAGTIASLVARLLAFLIFSIAMPPKNKTTELAEES